MEKISEQLAQVRVIWLVVKPQRSAKVEVRCKFACKVEPIIRAQKGNCVLASKHICIRRGGKPWQRVCGVVQGLK